MKIKIFEVSKYFTVYLIIQETLCFLIIYFFVGLPSLNVWEASFYQNFVSSFTWFENTNDCHPYLGYYNRSHKIEFHNSASNKDFKIAIVGGSVAESFGNYLLTPIGRDQLSKILNTSNEKENFNVINLAAGGHRQPQQSISTLLFMDKADLFISIEGLNEFLFQKLPCYPTTWNQQSIRYLPEVPIYRILIPKISKSIILTLAHLANSGLPSSRLAFYILKDKAYSVIHFLENYQISYLENKCLESADPSPNEKIQMWIRQIQIQHQLFGNSKTKLYTVFQPNQYYVDSKPWSESEKKLFEKNGYVANIVRNTYPKARSSFLKEQQTNVNLLDFTEIFKNHPEDIYIDRCCHFANRGNEILLNELSTTIQKSYEAFKANRTDL